MIGSSALAYFASLQVDNKKLKYLDSKLKIIGSDKQPSLLWLSTNDTQMLAKCRQNTF
jgi:hypothetical protein